MPLPAPATRSPPRLVKTGSITPLRHGDRNRIVLAFALVVLRQLLPQSPGFAPHRRVYAGIERLVFPKNLETQHVFLQLIGLTCNLLLHNESQKAAELRRMDERLAGENFLELGRHQIEWERCFLRPSFGITGTSTRQHYRIISVP